MGRCGLKATNFSLHRINRPRDPMYTMKTMLNNIEFDTKSWQRELILGTFHHMHTKDNYVRR